MFTNTTCNRYGDKISSLELCNFLNVNNKMLSYDILKERNHFNFNVIEYLRIQTVIRQTISNHSHRLILTAAKIQDFLLKKRTRAKHFRLYLSESNYNISKCKPSKSRYEWCEETLNNTREARFYSSWNMNFFTMEISEFAFDLVNKRLKFNASKAKFLENFQDPVSFVLKALYFLRQKRP